MKDQRWQDWLTSLAGLFVFFAPWIIPSTPTVAWALCMIGAATAIVGMSALAYPQRWEEWVALALGLCLLASPHLVGFSDVTALTWTAMIAGAIVAIVSGWCWLPTAIPDCDRGLSARPVFLDRRSFVQVAPGEEGEAPAGMPQYSRGRCFLVADQPRPLTACWLETCIMRVPARPSLGLFSSQEKAS